MSVVAGKSEAKQGNRSERAVADHIFRLRSTQRKRLFELVELWDKSESDTEREEIEEGVMEILFPEVSDSEGTRIEDERSEDDGKALAKHRETVGKRITKRRQRLKMTQAELAEKAGIAQSHVCRLEVGKHAPTYFTIEKIAMALGVTPLDLDPRFDD